jgi:BirA family transcriptional regulator, biotin operon repressor / biotin---[acetyl-CoA-carboxylase] ligase
VPTPAALERGEAPALSAAAIERWLADANAVDCQVEVVAATGSTNEDLLVRARQQQPEQPILRAADEQSAGRGCLKRAWLARPRTALLFSLAVPLASLPAALPAITLATGVTLAEYLKSRGVRVDLKWPNDVLLDGRKLAGILCEVGVDAHGRATLVIGVGANGWLTDEERSAIGQPAAALTEVVASTLLAAEREAWIAQIAAAVLSTVRRYVEDGFVPMRERYNRLLHARGEEVDIVDDGRITARGRVVEVDTIGRLVLATEGGLRAINVGDVSLRRADAQP